MQTIQIKGQFAELITSLSGVDLKPTLSADEVKTVATALDKWEEATDICFLDCVLLELEFEYVGQILKAFRTGASNCEAIATA